MTQRQVAEATQWSLSKVNRIEAGEVTVSRKDLLALTSVLDITAELQVELLRAGSVAWRLGWWDVPGYREYISPATLVLLHAEERATVVRIVHATLVPTLLRTPAYDQALQAAWGIGLPEDVIRARLEILMARRATFLERSALDNAYFLVDESALYREIGGPTVMAEQLQELLTYIEHDKVCLRITPFTEREGGLFAGPFTIVGDDDWHAAFVYREGNFADEIVQNHSVVNEFRSLFEKLWNGALGEEESTRLLRARLGTMLGVTADDGVPAGIA